MMKKLFILIGVLLVMLCLIVPLAPADSSTGQIGAVATGSVTSTGAAINISLGWQPSAVVVSRVSVTAANNFQLTYTDVMPNGSGVLHTAGALTWISTAGISKYAGTVTAPKGFTLGTNASINPSSPADTLYWEAYR